MTIRVDLVKRGAGAAKTALSVLCVSLGTISAQPIATYAQINATLAIVQLPVYLVGKDFIFPVRLAPIAKILLPTVSHVLPIQSVSLAILGMP